MKNSRRKNDKTPRRRRLYDAPNVMFLRTTLSTTSSTDNKSVVATQLIEPIWPRDSFFSFSFLSMLLLLLWIYGMGKGMEDRELCLYWAEPAGCPLYLLHIPLATLWRANGLPTSIVIQPLGAFSPFIFRRKRKNFVLFLFFLLWNSEMSVNIDMLVIMSYRPRPSMNLLLEYLIVLFFFYIKE